MSAKTTYRTFQRSFLRPSNDVIIFDFSRVFTWCGLHMTLASKKKENWVLTLREDVVTSPKFPFLHSLNQLIYGGDVDQHDNHVIFLLNTRSGVY